MKRIKRVFSLVHQVLWVLFSLLIVLQLRGEGEAHWFRISLGVLSSCLYVFYSHFFLLTQFLGKNKRAAYFLRLAAILLTGPLPFVIIHPKGLASWDKFFELYAMTMITAVILFVFLGWLARITENLVLNTIKKEQLEKQAVEAELYYLKSQINPHFLFNTLNNIYTLVYKQAATAPEAVLRLSSLMRYMIYESNAPTVPLSREMGYLQDYISLQQLRYKENPVVKLKLVGDPDTCFIAPLLFIHFLENAYKHSPARLKPGDIQVGVELTENSLIFRCKNPVAARQETTLQEPGGIGLPNIKKRLALLYPAAHTLEISNSVHTYAVVLKIHNLPQAPHERKDQLLYH